MRHAAARHLMPLHSGHVTNIGGRERRQRYLMGLAMLGVSAGLLVLLGRNEVSRWWRLAAHGAALGELGWAFQARAQT